MKQFALLLCVGLFLICAVPCMAIVEEGDAENFSELESGSTILEGYMNTIGTYPVLIDEALCAGDEAMYRENMAKLAVQIMGANQTIEKYGIKVKMDLWGIYHFFKETPYCGNAETATALFDTCYTAFRYNRQETGVEEDSDRCDCYDFATNSWKPTGVSGRGTCRCYMY